MANVDVVIRHRDEGSATSVDKLAKSLGGLKSSYGDLLKIGATVTAFFIGMNKAIQMTVGEYVKYADQVRQLNQLNGQTSEQNSRLIQLADDYKVSVENLNFAQRMLARDGINLTIESLADLSDQYLAHTNKAEANKFAQEQLGRGYQSFAEILQLGSEAIIENSKAIDGNLILTDRAVQQARDYQFQLDALTDTWQGLKIKAGQVVLPIVIEILEAAEQTAQVGNVAAGMRKLNDQYILGSDSLAEYKAQWTGFFNDPEVIIAAAIAGQRLDKLYVALGKNRQELSENEFQLLKTRVATFGSLEAVQQYEQALSEIPEGLDAATRGYYMMAYAAGDAATQTELLEGATDEAGNTFEELWGITQKLGEETANYNGQLSELNGSITYMTGRIAYLEGLSYLTPEQKSELDGLKTELGEAKTSVEELQKAHEKAALGIVFSMLQARLAVGGLDEDEFNLLVKTGEAFGILEGSAADVAETVGSLTTQFENGQISVDQYYDTVRAILELPSGKTFNYVVNYMTTGGSPIPDSGVGVGPGGQTAYASGGQLSGGWAEVGEEGPEGISPSGVVIPHTLWNAMKRSGFRPRRGYALGNLPMVDQAIGDMSTLSWVLPPWTYYNLSGNNGILPPGMTPSQYVNSPLGPTAPSPTGGGYYTPAPGGNIPGGGGNQAPGGSSAIVQAAAATGGAVQSVSQAAEQISASGRETADATKMQTAVSRQGDTELVTAINALRDDMRRYYAKLPKDLGSANARSVPA